MNKRGFLGHFGTVLTGTVLAQAINFLSYPFIARIYSPADFGVFALFLTAASVPGVISAWRFDLVIPTVSRIGYVAAYWLCIGLSLVSGIAAGAASALFSLISSSGWGSLFPMLVGLAVSFTGICAASTMYLLRQDGYRTTSAGIVTRTAVVVWAQISLAFWWRDANGLIIGYCLGFAAQVFVLVVAAERTLPAKLPRLRHLLAIFYRYRKQVAIDVPSTIIGALSLNLMAPLLILLFGNSIAGIYALAVRVAIIPMQVFNDALSQVFFQKAARAQNIRGNFWPEFKFSLLTSGMISLVVVIGIYLFAEPFVRFYLGSAWAQSGTVLTILAPMVGLSSVCMSLATSVFVLKRVHWLLFLNLATAGAQLLAFGISQALGLELNAFLTLTATVMGATYSIFILCLVRAVRRHEKGGLEASASANGRLKAQAPRTPL